jgi:hypothetical protein
MRSELLAVKWALFNVPVTHQVTPLRKSPIFFGPEDRGRLIRPTGGPTDGSALGSASSPTGHQPASFRRPTPYDHRAPVMATLCVPTVCLGRLPGNIVCPHGLHGGPQPAAPLPRFCSSRSEIRLHRAKKFLESPLTTTVVMPKLPDDSCRFTFERGVHV